MKPYVVDVIAGARPNFMKVAALFAVADQFPDLKLRLIHTGQHYDSFMSDVFFDEFGLPKPFKSLDVGSASHAVQTAEIMKKYEAFILENPLDFCIVVGDVNSTIACSLVVKKMGIPVAHVEAGLRSWDLTMPEEINRMVTDSICDLLFVTEPSGVENLKKEGHALKSVHHVGNVMIDTLFRMKEKAKDIKKYEEYSLKKKEYAFLTLHRPSNVDDKDVLEVICDELVKTSKQIPIIFPVHPRTQKMLKTFKLDEKLRLVKGIIQTEPLGYLDSVSCMMNAKVVITDSGGLQEEAAALQIPCLTLRHNTERPVTIDEGTNTLIAGDWGLYKKCIDDIQNDLYKNASSAISLWDGQSGPRILEICLKFLKAADVTKNKNKERVASC